MDRNDTIRRIKSALKRRSGKIWSVTGGRGTAWGWITIDVPPNRRTWTWEGTDLAHDEYGHPSLVERTELAQLLDLPSPIHPQGVSVAASSDHYQEYIDRAEGKTPDKIAQPYWD